ncbi:zinc ribbon domain-containing protein [Kurthia sp. YJT4]|uniref:zinc ribbon domain-containing protein n=1 Tax=Kurthia sp. YJT4 TaxID=3049086 RepID=UPI00254D0E56|nr:zinc ribbon domain-containing protein [Kurthia sp. YJT4]WIL37465.1 zinc ribbon domain-containing protein [Kurthia sp. YJT4]
MIKALNCPNCSAVYNPKTENCAYCGSYIIVTNKKSGTYQIKNEEKIYFNSVMLDSGEYPIRSGLANIYNSFFNSDGGQLLLTNRRLIFVTHGLNLNPNFYWETNLKDIQNVQLTKNLLISQHIIIITPKKKLKFVVYRGKEWIRDIEKAMYK